MSQTDSIWTEKSVKVFVNEIGCFNNHRNLVNGDSNFVDSEYRLERDIMWFYMVSSLVFKRKKLDKVHNSCIQVWIIGMLSAYHTTICKYRDCIAWYLIAYIVIVLIEIQEVLERK